MRLVVLCLFAGCQDKMSRFGSSVVVVVVVVVERRDRKK